MLIFAATAHPFLIQNFALPSDVATLEYMSADCIFVDPHMHLWDFKEHADVHDRRLLAGVRERTLSSHYDQEIEVSAVAM